MNGDRTPPASYWFARALILVAILVAAYAAWRLAAAEWLAALDRWIAGVGEGADRLNPF